MTSVGLFGAIGASLNGSAAIVVAPVAFVTKGGPFLSGTHIVILVFILAAAVVIYFSFVFGRAAKIRAEITKAKKLVEMSSGEKVR